ncbi:MAG: phospholipid carrier-dependent glycosyltransferase [Dehalococcoidia bacterium]|nr:phospholipid carrier-dependent glycosyltransferase [Dehalococcoidia bacterium]
MSLFRYMIRSPRLALCLIVLLAFLIRVHNLSFESIDMDEADAIAFASMPLKDTLALFTKPGENGPLYYLLLKGWMAFVGQSEFAVRFLSVIPGVLAVPVIYNLALMVFARRREGLIAAVLVTFSSYLLYYSQMTRMYSLVLLTSLLSGYLLLKALEEHKWGLWLLYALFATLSMYLHIFAALMVPWHLAYYLTCIARKDGRRSLRAGLTAFAVVTLPYLPLGLIRLSMIRNPEVVGRQYSGPQSPLGMLSTLSREYGTNFDGLPSALLYSFFAGMTLAGLISLFLPEKRRRLHWFLVFGLAAPISFAYVIVSFGAPLFSSRYLIITLPVFFLLWASAIAMLRERIGIWAYSIIAITIVLNGARWTESSVYGQHFREDWRGGSLYLKERITQEDLLIIPWPNVANAFRYYAGNSTAILSADAALAGASDIRLGPAFQKAAAGRKNVWFMRAYYQEGDMAPMKTWLEANTYVLDHQNFPGIYVTHYLISGGKPEVETKVSFGHTLMLLGYDRPKPPPDPGGPWAVKLYWQALVPMDKDYATVLAAVDSQGEIITKVEGAINQNRYPTSRWQRGWTMPEEKELRLPTLANGSYTLMVGVQELNGDARLTPDSDLWRDNLAIIGVVQPENAQKEAG